MDPEEVLISFGGELKALGEGKFGGYLVRFTTPDDPDLTGDYFTKSTEFYLEDGDPLPIIYDHGLNKTLLKRKIGRANVKFADAGLWLEGELNLRDEYEKAIYDKLVVAGKSGLSSGAASHLVTRKNIEGKKNISEILTWGLAEASITVAPTEPRNTAHAYSLKSYLDGRVDPFADGPPASTDSIKAATETPAPAATAPPAPPLTTEVKAEAAEPKAPDKTLGLMKRSMKNIFEEALAEKVPSSWELMDVLRDVCADIAAAATTLDISGGTVDIDQKVNEAVMAYASRLAPNIVKQIEDYVEADANGVDCGRFYLRSFHAQSLQAFTAVKGGLVSESVLDEHSAKVVSAAVELAAVLTAFDDGMKAYLKRCDDKAVFRKDTKAGRVLSAATLGKLGKAYEAMTTILDAMKESHTQIGTLMELAKEKKEGEEEDTEKSVKSGVLTMKLALEEHETEMAQLSN